MSEPEDDGILAVHFGHSGNCSSVGSIVDTLFVSAAVGTAVLAAVNLLLSDKERTNAEKPHENASGADAARPPGDDDAKPR